MKDRVHRVDAIVVNERRGAGEHFAQHHSKRKHVAATIDFLAQQLFRRHVVDGAHQRARLSLDVADQRLLFAVGGECAFAFGDVRAYNQPLPPPTAFFSRRIGRAPQIVPSGYEFTDVPPALAGDSDERVALAIALVVRALPSRGSTLRCW